MKISEILSFECILCAKTLLSKKTATEELAKLISDTESSLNRAEVFECLVAREKLGSTGIGHGVAIPHGRLEGNKKTIAAFEAAWKKLIRWNPATDAANAELNLERELLHNRLGNAVKILTAKISKSPATRAHYEKRADFLGKLGWTEWQTHEKKSLLVRFPSEYPPF